MTGALRTYTLIFTLPEDAAPPDRARRVGDVWSVEFGDAAFSSIPLIRREVLASGGAIVHENGARVSSPHQPSWPGGRFVLADDKATGRLSGVERGTTPCPTCSLPIATISVTEPTLMIDDPPPLAQMRGMLLMATGMRDRLTRDGLADGAEFPDVAAGMCLVLPQRRVRAGLGESPACDECGRTTVTINNVPRPAPARYAIAHSMIVPRGEGWWSHPAAGDAICVVSAAVARALADERARFREQRVSDVTDSSAWLEEELR